MKNKIFSIGFCLSLMFFFVAVQGQDKPKQNAGREVAITFDDVPLLPRQANVQSYRRINEKLLKSITANQVPAIGFVNEGKLYVGGKPDSARVEVLKMWVDAGLELGNHTRSHSSFQTTSLADYQQNVIGGEIITKKLLQEKKNRIRYFRHPNLRTGKTIEEKEAFEKFLARRGYTVAPVTIDNQDFMFAEVYIRAKNRNDTATMKRIGDAYIPYMEQMFEFYEKLSADWLGYEIKQILLLHANELNADYFDDLVRMMKRRGYKFVTLEEALTDKAYQLPDAQTSRGLSWLHRWMLAKGEQMKIEPSEPKFITELYNASRVN